MIPCLPRLRVPGKAAGSQPGLYLDARFVLRARRRREALAVVAVPNVPYQHPEITAQRGRCKRAPVPLWKGFSRVLAGW